MDLLERMKALNSEKEREFEPYHKSPLVKTMTNNWHTRQKDNLVSTDISMNMTDIKNSKKDSLIETSDERSNSTLKLANSKEKLRKNLDIEEEIEKERDEKE